jgi:predicted porin
MKKSLLALAVLGAFAATASAQSSVTLYGKIDVGATVDSGVFSPSGAHDVRIDSGVTGGSRVGFKGSEDLGGGLRANFQAETGVCADAPASTSVSVTDKGTGNLVDATNGKPAVGSVGNPACTGGNMWGRQTWVGLSGGFGSFSMGRQYTPGFLNLSTIDPFGTGYAGQSNNLFNPAGIRWSNSVIYSTPSMSGFQVTVGGAAGETKGNWKAGRQMGFSATYSAGPMYAGVAYNQTNDSAGNTGMKTWNAGGVYDFGMLKGHVMYGNNKDSSAIDGTTDNDDWLVGVTVPVGPGTIMASAIRHNDKTVANKDANQFGIGYNYALSKRTSLYAAIAHISEKNGAQYTVGNATEGGTGNQAVNLGIVHNF